MAQLRNKHNNGFGVAIDIHSDLGEVGDLSRFDGTTIGYIKIARGSEFIHGKVVTAGKVLVYKGVTGGSAIEHSEGTDLGVTTNGAREDKVILIHTIFNFSI